MAALPRMKPHVEDGLLSDDEDGDVCRICRMGSQQEDPLFHPCKCSGSIKYVHQQCLLDWLQHSGNTHCEVSPGGRHSRCLFHRGSSPILAGV